MTDVDKPVREIRINPIVPSESVLVATARSMRPKKAEAPAPRDTRAHVETCPFCTGNEHMTPPPIAAYPAAEDWQIRIVENLYPVLGDDRESPNLTFGLQQTIDGYGRHEVIIDNARHGVAIHEMGDAHLALLLGVYREHMEKLYRSNPRLRYVLVFSPIRTARSSPPRWSRTTSRPRWKTAAATMKNITAAFSVRSSTRR